MHKNFEITKFIAAGLRLGRWSFHVGSRLFSSSVDSADTHDVGDGGTDDGTNNHDVVNIYNILYTRQSFTGLYSQAACLSILMFPIWISHIVYSFRV